MGPQGPDIYRRNPPRKSRPGPKTGFWAPNRLHMGPLGPFQALLLRFAVASGGFSGSKLGFGAPKLDFGFKKCEKKKLILRGRDPPPGEIRAEILRRMAP